MLRVITSMNPAQGGPCQGIRNSVPQLDTLGVETHVVCMDNQDSDFLKNDSIRIFALGASKSAWAYNPALKSWLIENITNYDVVIVHGIWQYHSYIVNKVLMKLKQLKNGAIPKVFIMPHGMLDPYFQEAPDRKWKALRNTIYWKCLESETIRNADGLLFTCEEELLLARKAFSPYLPAKEINVSYGVQEPPKYSMEMKDAFASHNPKGINRPYFLFLSRIHSKKGVDMLLIAYENNFNKQNLNIDSFPMLIIAGPGLESEYGRNLQIKVENNEFLKKNIHFTGMLTGNSKWGALYGSEAFILPSHQENFGIAVVEAMACSKAVLITNKVNIYREISSNDAGVIFDDNISGIESALNRWTQMDNNAQVQMAKNSRIAYETKFTIKAAAQQFLNEILKTTN